MAVTVGSGATSLVDLCKGREGNERDVQLINMMSETHNLFADIRWKVCNSGATHKATIITKLPEAHMRRLYKGFKVSKGGRAQVTEDTGMAGTACVIDYKEFELNGKNADWLTQNVRMGTDALSYKVAHELFYGDRDKNPESINGLCKRMGKCNGTDKLKSSYNVMSAMDISDSTKETAVKKLTDLTSIYFVGHGDMGFYGLVPQGGSSVIHNNTVGLDEKHLVEDDEHNRYPAIEVQLGMDYGCCLNDFRYAARLANISVASLEQGSATYIDLWEKLTRMYYKINKYKGSAAWSIYVNAEIFTYLDLQAQKKVSPTLTYQTIDGKEILSYRGIPIKEDEAIVVGEQFVPADK